MLLRNLFSFYLLCFLFFSLSFFLTTPHLFVCLLALKNNLIHFLGLFSEKSGWNYLAHHHWQWKVLLLSPSTLPIQWLKAPSLVVWEVLKALPQRLQTPLGLLTSQLTSLETITTHRAVSQAAAHHLPARPPLQTRPSVFSHATFLSREQTFSKDVGVTESRVPYYSK